MRTVRQISDNQPNWDQIAATFTTTSEHPGRIRSHCSAVLFAACAALVLAIWVYVEDPNDAKVRAVAALFGGFGVVSLLSLFLLPRKCIAYVCDLLFSERALEVVLNVESRTVGGTAEFLKEMVILLASMTLFYVALESFNLGRITVGIVVGVMLCVWVLTLVHRQKFKGPQKLKASFEPELKKLGYSTQTVSQIKNARQLYAQTFLAQDLIFELKELWRKELQGKSLCWGYYVCGGKTVSSGVFGGVQFDRAPSLLKLGNYLSSVSSVYFDKASKSIYGTFEGSENLRVEMLAGVPWQYAPGRGMIVRFDSWLLDYVENNPELSSINASVLIDAVTLLAGAVEEDCQ
ncbi:MAG: hypothetical protein ABJZ55_04860 [Fuerstiella sp.]